MSSEPAVNATPDSGATPDSTVLYLEKLWPTPGIWLIVLGLSAAGILMFIPISTFAGYAAAVIMLVIQVVALLWSTPTIKVTRESLQVGRAHIERSFVGDVTAYRDAEAMAQRGPRLNGLAFLCLRGWIQHVVRIEITDPADPTPYWLASSRRPEQLAKALRS
ncbi:DUF3093 domain-containing protein [Specibacter cremeus]|uniref:DUF3093 domain-containing protein n=1 Tax=Specibacter cremeus TaxID=1629051 RepID=UPI000F7ADF97|nr:DUF3093 domain-containing protein [Specibacter cremeus]